MRTTLDTQWLRPCILFLAMVGPGLTAQTKDPFDDIHAKNFYLTTNGLLDGAINAPTLQAYRTALGLPPGTAQPKNLKIGIAGSLFWMLRTHDAYFDYLYNPNHSYSPGGATARLGDALSIAAREDLYFTLHLNGAPWGDSAVQSLVCLHNHLEKTQGTLQLDQAQRFRNAANNGGAEQDEMGPEPVLEMQLQIGSANTALRAAIDDRLLYASRLAHWYADRHPDCLASLSGSSEIRTNFIPTSPGGQGDQYFDYSTPSQDEFRAELEAEWTPQGGLTAFNNTYNLNFPAWSSVTPPTSPDWGNVWWLRWHAFRVAQVRRAVQREMTIHRAAGWSPDRIFSHQIPGNPDPLSSINTQRYASPWTTAFAAGAGTGVTLYGSATRDEVMVAALLADDPFWGAFEYNPISADATAALNLAWTGQARVICPHTWQPGQAPLTIPGTPFETALRNFVTQHAPLEFVQTVQRHTVAPSSLDLVWRLSQPEDVEGVSTSIQLAANSFTDGQLHASLIGGDPWIELALDEQETSIDPAHYWGVSFRMNCAPAAPSSTPHGKLYWHNGAGPSAAWHSVMFPLQSGMQTYQIDLADIDGWKLAPANKLRIDPVEGGAGANPGSVDLDWVRLHSAHAWELSSPSEVYGAFNWHDDTVVDNGEFRGTAETTDPYFYLSTDKNQIAAQADRAFVNADVFKLVKFRMSSDTPSTAVLHWWRRGDPTVHFVSIPVTNVNYQDYTIDLSANTNWRGEVTRLRLDPVNTTAFVRVDWIRILPGRFAPDALSDRVFHHALAPKISCTAPVHGDPTAYYEFEVARSPNFAMLEVFGPSPTNSFTLPTSSPVRDGLFWWRARNSTLLGAKSTWSVPMPVFFRAWTFDRVEDARGLSTSFGTPSVSNGVWSCPVQGNDPFLFLHLSEEGVDTGLYDNLVINFRATGGTGTFTARVWVSPTDDVTGRFLDFPNLQWGAQVPISVLGLKAVYGQGPNPSSNPIVWTLRFDPIQTGAAAGQTVEIFEAYVY